jgi:hypothetical protein
MRKILRGVMSLKSNCRSSALALNGSLIYVKKYFTSKGCK